ncbi:hypothetical protein OPIT5_30355 [Opitutaceae bacterium TAV5]|nr:hypothetical protein OPIT5_30355 [Opitutaceae bacterium TAV5]
MILHRLLSLAALVLATITTATSAAIEDLAVPALEFVERRGGSLWMTARTRNGIYESTIMFRPGGAAASPPPDGAAAPQDRKAR